MDELLWRRPRRRVALLLGHRATGSSPVRLGLAKDPIAKDLIAKDLIVKNDLIVMNDVAPLHDGHPLPRILYPRKPTPNRPESFALHGSDLEVK
jgi:hypothetical protein